MGTRAMVGWGHGPGHHPEIARETGIAMGQSKSYAETMQLDLSAWLFSIIGSVQLVWDCQIFELTDLVTAEFRDLLDGLSVITCPGIMIHCVSDHTASPLCSCPQTSFFEKLVQGQWLEDTQVLYSFGIRQLPGCEWRENLSLVCWVRHTHFAPNQFVSLFQGHFDFQSSGRFWESEYETICILFKAAASEKPFPGYHFLLPPVSRSEIQNLAKFNINNHFSKPLYIFQPINITKTL